MATGTRSNKVAITFTANQFDWLNAYATANDVSFSEAVRVAVQKHIDTLIKKGPANPRPTPEGGK